MEIAMQTKFASRQEVLQVLNAHKVSGKVFGVRFIKKDNTVRKMACRFGVRSHLLTNGTPSTVAHIPKYITVFDMQKSSYRNVNLDTLLQVAADKITYILT
jgi:hypothetical protein